MVTKQRSTGPYAAIGIFVGAIVPLMLATAIFADGHWAFNVNTLSDLGVSRVQSAADIFNWTCIIAGILLIIFGTGKTLAKSGLDGASAMFVAFAGLFLIGVGVCVETSDYHNFFAWTFFGLMFVAVLVGLVSDWKKGRKVTAAVTIVMLFVVLGSAPGLTLGGIEVVGTVGLFFWIIAQGLSLAFSKN
jgi:hypothetical membrane protein